MWEAGQVEIDPSNLPDFCRKPSLVLGVGNLLFGDDGFGCAVVDYIESHYQVPEAVCLLDAGTGVRKLLFTLCLSSARPRRLLILDAIDAGRTPGEIFEIDPAEIPVVKLDDFSMHQLPTSNLLRELQKPAVTGLKSLFVNNLADFLAARGYGGRAGARSLYIYVFKERRLYGLGRLREAPLTAGHTSALPQVDFHLGRHGVRSM